MSTQNIQNLLAVWDRRPGRTLEFDNVEDWNYILEILTATKNAIPEIRSISGQVNFNVTGGVPLNRNPQNGVTVKSDEQNAPTVEKLTEGAWQPRWLRESTSPNPVTVAPVVPTPSSVAPSEPETARSIHSPTANQHEADTDALNDLKSGTVGTLASADAKLAAARKVAATSKQPSSPKPSRKRTKASLSVLP